MDIEKEVKAFEDFLVDRLIKVGSSEDVARLLVRVRRNDWVQQNQLAVWLGRAQTQVHKDLPTESELVDSSTNQKVCSQARDPIKTINAETLQAQGLNPDQSSSAKEIEGLLLTIARQQAQINLFEKKLKEFTDAVGAGNSSIPTAKPEHETQALTPDNKDPMFSIANAVSMSTPRKEGDKNAAGQEFCTILPPKQEGALSEDMKLPIVYLRKDQLKQLKRRGPLLGELNNSPRPDLVGLYLLNPEVLDGNN